MNSLSVSGKNWILKNFNQEEIVFLKENFFLDEEEKLRAKKLGIKNFDKKYNIEDMIKGDVIFCASGVTSGDLAKGVIDLGNKFEVNTFALHKSQKTIKNVSNIYNK